MHQTASSTPIFESLAEQGLLLTNYNSVTHPSEPNCASHFHFLGS
jgi:hypothetical protein